MTVIPLNKWFEPVFTILVSILWFVLVFISGGGSAQADFSNR